MTTPAPLLSAFDRLVALCIPRSSRCCRCLCGRLKQRSGNRMATEWRQLPDFATIAPLGEKVSGRAQLAPQKGVVRASEWRVCVAPRATRCSVVSSKQTRWPWTSPQGLTQRTQSETDGTADDARHLRSRFLNAAMGPASGIPGVEKKKRAAGCGPFGLWLTRRLSGGCRDAR